MRSKRTWVLALGVLALLVAACSSSNNTSGNASAGGQSGKTGTTVVRFLKSNSWDAGTGGGFYSAVDQGYFAKEGIEAKPLVAEGAATGVAALISGSADIGQTTPDAFMNAVAQGADLVAVWQWLKPGVFGTLVNTDAGINSLADLKGKKIGVINRSSATYFSPLEQLYENGMTDTDAQFVDISCCSAQYTALESGQVDAVGTWDTNYLAIEQQAKDEGKTAWLNQTKIYWNSSYLADILVTTRTYLQSHEAAVEGFVRGLKAGDQFEADHPDQALAIAAKNVSGVTASDANLQIVKTRAASWADGTFDYPQLEKSLELYYTIGLTTANPAGGAIDLHRLFVSSVANAVNG
jgi:NitT/TauT family transport system substrate-binding protein